MLIRLSDPSSLPTRDSSPSSNDTLTADGAISPKSNQQTTSSYNFLRPLISKDVQKDGCSTRKSTGDFLHSDQSTLGRLPKEPRKRRLLDQASDEYRETRKLSACVRCRLRRVKCGTAKPCVECVKAVVPLQLCSRTQIRELLNHRPGLAHEFIDSFEDCIIGWDEADQKKEIKVWHGLHSSLSVKVTQFSPRRPIVDLWWKNPTGWMKTHHTPFGIRNPLDVGSNALDTYVYSQIPFLLDKIEAKYKRRNTAPDQHGPEPSNVHRGSKIWLQTMRAIHDHIKHDSGCPKMLERALLLWAYTFMVYHALWQFTPEPNHNKLGMAQLSLRDHDCETLTEFNDATTLPRLLFIQLHKLMEIRMTLLEKSLVAELHNFYAPAPNPAHNSSWMSGYLATWVYLSILEEVVWDVGRWENLREVSSREI